MTKSIWLCLRCSQCCWLKLPSRGGTPQRKTSPSVLSSRSCNPQSRRCRRRWRSLWRCCRRCRWGSPWCRPAPPCLRSWWCWIQRSLPTWTQAGSSLERAPDEEVGCGTGSGRNPRWGSLESLEPTWRKKSFSFGDERVSYFWAGLLLLSGCLTFVFLVALEVLNPAIELLRLEF